MKTNVSKDLLNKLDYLSKVPLFRGLSSDQIKKMVKIMTTKKFDKDSFIIKEGDAVLEIRKVKSSWGCTAALLSSEEINPGEKGEIKTVFNPAGRHGPYKKTIKVYSNDKKNPIMRLYIKMDIKEKEAKWYSRG